MPIFRWVAAAAFLLAASTGFAQHVWLDAEDEPVPFDTEAELEEFLRTAAIVDEKPIGVGINKSVKLTLEQDGVRVHAIFREVDHRERGAVIEGTNYPFFADSYLFECAAFELGKLLDMPHVPPAVLRVHERRRGSVQIWIEDALDESDESFRPPKPLAWASQLWDMVFFDNIIYNIDRNPGNLLVSADYKLWLIDHTRAFQFKYTLLNEDVTRVPKTGYERLMALDEKTLQQALRDYLTPREIGAILQRRDAMKTLVDKMLETRIPAAVFY